LLRRTVELPREIAQLRDVGAIESGHDDAPDDR
jgi:hypothetical protein